MTPQRMCLHMRAGCGSILAHAAIRSRPEPFHQKNTQTRIPGADAAGRAMEGSGGIDCTLRP